MRRVSLGELGFALAALLFFSLFIFIVAIPKPESCKQTGAKRQITSFVIAGRVIVPYTFEQPVYKCSKKENTND